MNTDCSICYVSSIDYLLPSIISAVRVRQYVPSSKAYILILAALSNEALVNDLNKFLLEYQIKVISFEKEALEKIEGEKTEGYISSTTLGRFHIADLLPVSCRRIVYIDGDTWITQDPSALIEAEVPEGRIAAAEDIISFRSRERSPAGDRIRKYFGGIGVDPRAGYFNSGVLAVATKTWRGLSAEALSYFKDNRELCDCLDQSALNAVAKGRRLKLSLRWNFQSPARFLGAEKSVSPVVYHFNQYVKPWMGHCKPWSEMYEPYTAAMREFEPLQLRIPMISAEEVSRHNKLTLAKNIILDYPALARLLPMYKTVRSYEHDVWL